MKFLARFAACAALLAALQPAWSQEPDSCRTVRFVDIGWSDITATTALATTVLEGLGYKPTTTIASVPISLAGLKSKQIDVSLGYWWPLQVEALDPFLKANTIVVLDPPNLSGAKTTLAVPRHAFDAGLKSFSDIARFKEELDGKIYGIEAGSSANAKIRKMIETNQFGLGGFKLVESSGAGMLVSVKRAAQQKKMIVFLGWEPHPMNIQMAINYLDGGDAVFGPDFGSAKVYTLVAPDFRGRCPNAGKLVANLRFTTEIENRMMVPIMDKQDPAGTARAFLKQNPEVLTEWLSNVTTFDGKEGLPAVRTWLGL